MTIANHAQAAFISSHLLSEGLVSELTEKSITPINTSQSFQTVSRALENLSVKLGELVSMEEVEGKSQKEISLGIDLHNKDCLLDEIKTSSSLREQARMASLSLPHAGDWLNTTPILSLGLHLRSSEFIPAARYRLGVPVYESDSPCIACQRHNDI